MGTFNGVSSELPISNHVQTSTLSNHGFASPSSTVVGCPSETSSSCFGQIRPNCLSRRTSYRTNQKVSIPVASPMSPVDGHPVSSGRGSECSFEIKSPSQQSVVSSNSSSSCCISPFGNGNRMQSEVPRMMMRRYPTLPEDESCSESGSTFELHSRELLFNNNNSHQGRITVFDQTLKPYESLKSQISNSSQGSCGSKMTSSSTASDKSLISRGCMPPRSEGGDDNACIQPTENASKRGYHPPHHHGNKHMASSVSQPISIDTTLGDETLQEETIKGLSFVSPKSGVYRPMADSRKHRQNCIVM